MGTHKKVRQVSLKERNLLFMNPLVEELYWSIMGHSGFNAAETYLWVSRNPLTLKRAGEPLQGKERVDDGQKVLLVLKNAEGGILASEILRRAELEGSQLNQAWIGRWLPAQERKGLVKSYKRPYKNGRGYKTLWMIAQGEEK